VSEALAVAASMRVKQLTVLTHFSQRYAIRPFIIPESTTTTSPSVVPIRLQSEQKKVPFAVAFDFLHFSFPSHCTVLPEVTRLLGDVLEQVNSH
jgi:hypothetical protein